MLLDGEIVALDEAGAAVGFTRLQGRIHLARARDVTAVRARQPAAFVAFDLLRDGALDLRTRPFAERRRALERMLASHRASALRISELAEGDGRPLLARAAAHGWEGIIAKRLASARGRPTGES